jgi:hypothetical protein
LSIHASSPIPLTSGFSLPSGIKQSHSELNKVQVMAAISQGSSQPKHVESVQNLMNNSAKGPDSESLSKDKSNFKT